MNTHNDGGPAMPCVMLIQVGDPVYTPPTQVHHSGMSLRDYFAAKALQGIIASRKIPGLYDSSDCMCLAEQAYMQSDAMLIARAKERP